MLTILNFNIQRKATNLDQSLLFIKTIFLEINNVFDTIILN